MFTAQLAGDSTGASVEGNPVPQPVNFALSVPEGKYHVVFQARAFCDNAKFDLDLRSGPQREFLDLRLELERVSSSVVVTGGSGARWPIQQTTGIGYGADAGRHRCASIYNSS